MRVILDTSLLMNCVESRVDLVRELERIITLPQPVIVDKTIDELKKHAAKKTKDGAVAKTVLTILDTLHIGVIRTVDGKESVDDLIVYNATKDDYVATMDAFLKRRLKGKIKGIIVLRKKQHLEIA